jgi:hypothetical protein
MKSTSFEKGVTANDGNTDQKLGQLPSKSPDRKASTGQEDQILGS